MLSQFDGKICFRVGDKALLQYCEMQQDIQKHGRIRLTMRQMTLTLHLRSANKVKATINSGPNSTSMLV